MVLALVVAAVLTLGALIVLTITGLAGARGGWLWAGLILATGPALVALPFCASKRLRGGIGGALLAGGLVAGSILAAHTPFTHGRLRHELAAVQLPAGLRPTGSEEFGNAVCIDSCSSITQQYTGRAAPERWLGPLRRAFEAAHFVVDGWSTDTEYTGAVIYELHGSKGRLLAGITVSTDPRTDVAGNEIASSGLTNIEITAETEG